MSSPATNLNLPVVHSIRLDITFADRGKQMEIGVVPKGSAILKPISGVNVSTAFNGSGTDLLDIGISSNDDLFATDLSVAAEGFQAFDEAISNYVTADTKFTATYADANSDATAGVAQVVVCFIPPDPAQK